MCAVAAFSWEAYFGGSNLQDKFVCVLGFNALESVYVVYDVKSREARIAVAEREREARYVTIPKDGVPA